MATIPFKYYMHDSGEELAEMFYNQIADKFDGDEADLAKLIGYQNPFYEIALNCELDSKTGEITIVSLGEES